MAKRESRLLHWRDAAGARVCSISRSSYRKWNSLGRKTGLQSWMGQRGWLACVVMIVHELTSWPVARDVPRDLRRRRGFVGSGESHRRHPSEDTVTRIWKRPFLARAGRHSPIVLRAGPCHACSMGAKTMRAKSWKAAGQCAGQPEPPYGYAAVLPGLHERAMKHGSETARSAVRCQHCLPNLRGRPVEGSGALPERGSDG